MEEDEIREYEKLIKANIEYNSLSIKLSDDKVMLDEILALITETVCTSKKYLTIAGDTFPKEVVRSRFLKINSMHVEYIIDCLKANTTNVRNIKKYLLAAIFNAPSTIENYYSARVNHDML